MITVNKYNKTYHNTIKIKPVDVKSSTCIDFGTENNHKNPKFKVGDHVGKIRFSMFSKGYSTNCSEEVFVMKKVKNTLP